MKSQNFKVESKKLVASSATERFKNEPYDGNKLQFQEFEDEIMTVVSNTCGKFGLDYLKTAWPIDANSLPVVGDHYKVLEVPPSLDLPGARVGRGAGPTLEEKKDRREQIKATNDYNSKIEEMVSDVSTIITERVTVDLNQKNLEYGGIPIYFWNYLKKGCSKDQLGDQDVGDEFIRSLSFNMEHTQRFKAWLTKFEQKTVLCEYNEKCKLGLLLSDGTNVLGIKVLPDRLDNAITRCKIDNLSFKDTVNYITKVDEKHHQEGIKLIKNKIRAIKNDSTEDVPNAIACYNCSNYCHSVYQCRLDACGNCRQFGVNHKCNDCPLRRERDNEGRDTYRDRQGRGRGRGRGSNRGRGRGRGQWGRGSRGRSTDYDAEKTRYRGQSRDSSQKPSKDKKRSYKERDEDEDDEDDYSERSTKSRKQRVQRAVSRSDVESDFQYSEDDYEGGYDEDDMEDEVDIIPMRKIRAIKKVQILGPQDKFLPRPIKFLCDSGAEDHCIPPNGRDLLQDYKPYMKGNSPNVELVGPTGEPLTLLGKGDANTLIRDVYEVDNLLGKEGICSLQRLRADNLWSIIPPRNMCPNNAVIICDSEGQVQLVTDKNFYADIKDTGMYQTRITLPDIPQCIEVSKPTRRVRAIYGYEATGVEDLVDFVYQAFLFSKNDMIWTATNQVMDGFPITGEQARRHYKTQPCKVAGNMQMRKSDNRQFATDQELEDSPLVRVAHDDNAVLNQDRLQVGRRVGTDLYGPYMNVTASCFQDYASGFGRSTFVTHSTRKGSAKTPYKKTKKGDIPDTLRWARGLFNKYNWQIQKLTSDSDAIYAGVDYQAVCSEEPVIEHVMSPAEDHASNGHIESYVKVIQNRVTSMYCLAPYFPHQLWPRVWDTAETVNNMRPSKVPGSTVTRWEEFTRKRPNYRRIVILPHGIPILYIVTKQQRDKKFVKKSRYGMYVGPNLKAPGAIIVWNPITMKFASRSTYRVLKYSQAPYEWKPLDPLMMVREAITDGDEPTEYIALVPDESHAEDSDDLAEERPLVIQPTLTTTANTTSIEDTVENDVMSTEVTEPNVTPTSDAMTTNQPIDDHSASSHTSEYPVDETVEGEARVPASEVSQSMDYETVRSHTSILPPRVRGSWQDGPAKFHTKSHINSMAAISEKRVRFAEPLVSEGASSKTTYRARAANPTVSEGADRLSCMKRPTKSMKKRNRIQMAKRAATQIRIAQDEDSLTVEYVVDKKVIRQKVMAVQQRQRAYYIRKKTTRMCKPLTKHKAKKRRDYDNPTLEQAMAREDWLQWKEAIDAELAQMIQDDVYVKVSKLPNGANLVGSMFVLTIKRDTVTGKIDKYKARLVALGNQQRKSSYDKIKSNTARGSSVKLITALQAKTKAFSMVLDVKGAYLKSKVDESKGEKLYVRLPSGEIVKLKRYLYGLKQAGAEWEKNITNTLIKHGYKRTADPLLFIKWQGDDFIAMTLHVDDFYVISTKQNMLDTLYDMLTEEYDNVTKKSGNLLTYLGMAVSVNGDSTVTITQPAYVEKMLVLAGMQDCKSIATPMAVDQTFNDMDQKPVDKTNYLSLVGLLNYLAMYTRPDLLYSLSRVAQACSMPTNADLRRVHRIFRYVQATKNQGITYTCDRDFSLRCYVDASFNCYDDGRSHYGYTFSLGKSNGSFYAKSAKMKTIPLSSTEAEYIALSLAANEIVFLRRLLNDMGFDQTHPTLVFEDNMSAIKMVLGDLNHQTTKHIRVKYHYTKALVKEGEIRLKYIETDRMTADILTKALAKDKHDYFHKRILNTK